MTNGSAANRKVPRELVRAMSMEALRVDHAEAAGWHVYEAKVNVHGGDEPTIADTI
jgi:hypothetical protein